MRAVESWNQPLIGLMEARAQIDRLTTDLADHEARAQSHPDLSPVGWHLGHVAWQEEVWLHRKLLGRAPIHPSWDGLFDSFRSEKGSRGERLPPLEAIRAYVRQVRERTLAAADDERLQTPTGTWTLRFLANHERQHGETAAAARLWLGVSLPPLLAPPAADTAPPSSRGGAEERWQPIAGGAFVQGSEDPEGWDNERDRHEVLLPPFSLATHLVTNGDWLHFMEAGGYGDERLWTEEGRRLRAQAGLVAPLYWRLDRDRGWRRRTLWGEVAVEPSHPVAFVSWYEASAFAAFAGARLPTESEWERVAGWEAQAATQRRWPVGDHIDQGANWGQVRFDTSPVGGAASLGGPKDLSGNVWEWTSSPFLPYTGFRPGPYRGYSLPWFGEGHRVLRGGSFLTHPLNARAAFRNWLPPATRCFATGLRLARR